MADIIPAILSNNYEDLKNNLSLVRHIVPIVQIDICDGIFTPHMTWPFLKKPKGDVNEFELDYHFQKILNEQEGMPFWEDLEFELDLMVQDAMENFDIYTKMGPRRIVFHLEALKSLEDFKEFLEGVDPFIKESVDIGIAFGTNIDLEKVYTFGNVVDFFQVMGIKKIGFQGEPFNEECLDYVKALKEKFPDVPVSVDGSVNFDTANDLLSVGADRLVIGSAIFNTNDIINTIEEFKNL
ncbi:MAG: hypothetical protein K9L98_02400 [Candidatus Pacebacteria bacterium]|nr:hypothetical protein [Candidatus Paceibacterota bacterium]MCF7862837.1 hypothetical protein [Candidatus Paceibacterota bacterium]